MPDLIKPTSGPPPAPEPVKGHPKIFAESCSICTHEHRAAIEELYVGCRRISMIAGAAQVSEDDIKKHAIALGLDKQRAQNPELLAAHAINASFDRGVLDELDADQTIRLMDLSAKMQGKVKEANQGRPPAVMIVGVPVVGRVVVADSGESAQTQSKIVQGRTVETLPLPIFAAEETK